MSYSSFDFPHTHFYDTDLRELIKKVFELTDTVTKFVSINAIKYADPIQWNITSQYEKNTIVIDPQTGTAYVSVADVPSGVALTREDYWTVVFDLGSFVTKAAQNLTSNYEKETTTTATISVSAGEWIVWNDVLYRALVNITAGDAYVIGSNIEKTTIEEIKNEILSIIDNLYKEISKRVGNIADLTTSNITSIVNAINSIITERGALSGLTTSNTTSIVNAINSIITERGALNSLDTTDKTSIVNAINDEVQTRQTADDDLRNLILSASSYYDTIEDLKKDTDVSADKNCVVNGYYNSGDCDIMIWHTSKTSSGDFGEITLSNGLYAHLLKSNENYYNVKQYGAYGDGAHDDYSILNDVINEARQYDNSIVYIPAGEYIIHIYLDALRTNSVTNVTRDFKGLTICGDGKETLIHGKSSTDIFDVMQINEGCNLNIKDLALTETNTASGLTYGANGISLTNGCYNITVENVYVYNLPVYVGGDYVDGGKAFTVQTNNTNTINVNNITFINCSSKNVAMGFEFDAPASNAIKYQVNVKDCKFDVNYNGLVISFPSFGSGAYSSSAFFNFTGCYIKSRQKCVTLSRGSNVNIDNCIFEQYETPLKVLPSDTSVQSLTTYASQFVYITNCTFLSSFGDYAIIVKADGNTASKFIILKDILIGNSFTIAGATVEGSPTNDIYLDNFNNFGAPTSFTAAFRSACNTALNYGGYQIFNNLIMTDKTQTHTLGTYNGSALPIYNSIGSQIGWLPLYS